MTDIAKIDGNEDDGWNVVITEHGFQVTLACEDREHADELVASVNRTSWMDVKELP